MYLHILVKNAYNNIYMFTECLLHLCILAHNVVCGVHSKWDIFFTGSGGRGCRGDVGIPSTMLPERNCIILNIVKYIKK